VNGGFPPPAQVSACSGSACQGVPPAPPIFATPPSVTYNGVGNFAPPAKLVVKPKKKTKAKPKQKPKKQAKAKSKAKARKQTRAKKSKSRSSDTSSTRRAGR
jgi:hypothetical protein